MATLTHPKSCSRCGSTFDSDGSYDLDICLGCAERELTAETHPVRFIVDAAPFVGVGTGLLLHVSAGLQPLLAVVAGIVAWSLYWATARVIRDAIVERVVHR